MRRLKPLEVLALTALMSIGGNADAQEAEEGLPITLATVTSTYTDFGWSQFYLPANEIIYYNPGPPYSLSHAPSRPTKPVPSATTKQKALTCVSQYGQYPAPAPGWSIDYNAKWGFRNPQTGTFSFPPNYVNPAAGTWDSLHGTTRPIGGVNNRITIFQLGYSSFSNLVNTLAHEIAHSWGASESDAGVIGDEAEAEFNQDNGAKCGGL